MSDADGWLLEWLTTSIYAEPSPRRRGPHSKAYQVYRERFATESEARVRQAALKAAQPPTLELVSVVRPWAPEQKTPKQQKRSAR